VGKVPGSTVVRNFFIEHFARDQILLSPATNVACVAAAGQTTQYFELGTIDQLQTKSFALTELATDASIRFRVLFYDHETSKVLASADNIRAVDENSSSPSLVSIEPGPLDGPLWKLELPVAGADDRPVLMVEEKLFSSAKAAVAHPMFLSFVLPEVVRSVATRVVEDDADPTDQGSWLSPWTRFFSSINSRELDDSADEMEKEEWIDECVKAFCRRGQMAASIDKVLQEVTGELT